MRQDYKTLTTLSLQQKKDYLLKINHQDQYIDDLYGCFTMKQLNTFLEEKKTNKYFFVHALRSLYNSKNYDDLEYHIMMMNSLFDYQSYQDIKKQLLEKLCKKTITINEYCVMRHLVDFENIPFQSFINYLHKHYSVDQEECARICLLEDQHHLAFEYLKALDNCYDKNLLDLLCSYSLYEYTSLIRSYNKKQKNYSLATTH